MAGALTRARRAVRMPASARAGLDVRNRAATPPISDAGTSLLGLYPKRLSAEVLADSPAGYWRLGESSGSTFADSAGSGTATASGGVTNPVDALITDPDLANKFSWSGVLPQATTSVPIGGSGAMTVECWARFDDFVLDPASSGYFQTVNALLFLGSASAGGSDGWCLGVTTAGRLYWARHGFGDATLTTGSLTAGLTYHIAVVLNAAQTSMDVYLNGAFVQTTAVPSGAAALGGVAINNGSTGANNHPRCRVTLDEVAIYTTALSAARLAAHYAAGTAGVGVAAIADSGTSTITLTAPVIAFPSTPVRDDFNAGAAQNVDTRAGWKSSGSYPEFWGSMVTDAVPTYAAGFISSNAWGTPFANPEVWSILGAWPSVNDLRMYGRWDETAQTGYWLQVFNINATNWFFQIRKRLPGGADVTLPGGITVGSGGFGGVTLLAGDGVGLRIVGAELSAWLFQGGVWTNLITVQDSTYNRIGDIGWSTEDHVLTFDSVGGGEAVSAAFQAISDTGSSPQVLDGSNSTGSVSGGNPSDAGTSTLILVSSAAEALRDTGSSTQVLASSSSEAFTDTGTSTQQIAQSGAEKIADQGASPQMLAPGAVDTGVLDAFNDGAGGNVSARPGWGSASYWSGEPTMIVNGTPDAIVVPNTSGWFANYWNTSSADQEAGGTIGAVGVGQSWAFATRSSVGNNPSEYELTIAVDSGAWTVELWVAGALSATLAIGTFPSHAAGDSVKLRSVGSRHTVFFKPSGGSWVPQATIVDATLASGVPTVQGRAVTTPGSLTDFIGGAFVTDYFEAILDVGTSAQVLDSSNSTGGVSNPSDSGTSTMTLVSTASEALRDSGSSTQTLVSTALEGPVDSGTSPQVITPSGAEALRDAGTSTQVIASSSSERITDAGTSTQTLVSSSLEQLTDSGTSTQTLSSTSLERISEAGSSTSTITSSSSEAISDAGTSAAALLPSGADALSNAGSSTATVLSSSPLEAVADVGASTQTIAGSSTFEAIADGGSSTQVITPTGVGGVSGADPSDAGTSTITLASSAQEAISELGTGSATILSSGTPTVAEAGASVVSLAASGIEWLADSGSSTQTLSSSSSEAIRDSGSSSSTITSSAAEAIAESGSSTQTIVSSSVSLEAGTSTVSLSSSGIERISDYASGTMTLVSSGTATGGGIVITVDPYAGRPSSGTGRRSIVELLDVEPALVGVGGEAEPGLDRADMT